MNLDKAREYFSSYHEGTLEGGLRASFEQKLRSDKQLEAEFRAFERAMDELDILKLEEIPVPSYLNARIHARLDEARKPAKQTKGLLFYLPRFSIAAAAVLAIGVTGVSILHPGQGKVETAGAFGSWPQESIGVEANGGAAVIHYSSATDRNVKVRDGSGNELKSYELGTGQVLKTELSNPNGAAAVFEVQVSDGGPDVLIAVPGTTPTKVGGDQRGTVLDFQKALADHYRAPVILSTQNSSQPIAWNLSQPDSKSAADKAFEGTGLTETVTASGVLSLSDN
jgi:hypothetical protein